MKLVLFSVPFPETSRRLPSVQSTQTRARLLSFPVQIDETALRGIDSSSSSSSSSSPGENRSNNGEMGLCPGGSLLSLHLVFFSSSSSSSFFFWPLLISRRSAMRAPSFLQPGGGRSAGAEHINVRTLLPAGATRALSHSLLRCGSADQRGQKERGRETALITSSIRGSSGRSYNGPRFFFPFLRLSSSRPLLHRLLVIVVVMILTPALGVSLVVPLN